MSLLTKLDTKMIVFYQFLAFKTSKNHHLKSFSDDAVSYTWFLNSLKNKNCISEKNYLRGCLKLAGGIMNNHKDHKDQKKVKYRSITVFYFRL
jgi:hypothetical protein